jgi:hypothetical protein
MGGILIKIPEESTLFRLNYTSTAITQNQQKPFVLDFSDLLSLDFSQVVNYVK